MTVKVYECYAKTPYVPAGEPSSTSSLTEVTLVFYVTSYDAEVAMKKAKYVANRFGASVTLLQRYFKRPSDIPFLGEHEPKGDGETLASILRG